MAWSQPSAAARRLAVASNATESVGIATVLGASGRIRPLGVED